jgi:hypothetical protein
MFHSDELFVHAVFFLDHAVVQRETADESSDHSAIRNADREIYLKTILFVRFSDSP